MDLDEALWHVAEGNAILFVGAGFSRAATNLRSRPFKSAIEFADSLANAMGFPPGTPLPHIADEFASAKGDDALVHELNEEFSARDVAAEQVRLAAQPWRRIYTTNYDNVLETAAARAGQKLVPITTGDDIRNLPKHDTLCVHLNGFVDRLSRDSIQRELKLTERSYLAEALHDTPWAVMFRQDILAAKTLIFVGYSIADLDIGRLLFQTPQLRDKCFFVLDPSTAKVTVRRAGELGTVLPMSSAEFARAADAVTSSYSPADGIKPAFTCFREYKPAGTPVALGDERMFDLLLWGRVQPSLLAQSVQGAHDYIAERHAVDRALEILRTTNALVIMSHLGNGKTLTLEALKVRAAAAGYSVFDVVNRTPDILQEADLLMRRTARPLLIVDDYPNWLDLVRYIGANRTDQVSVVVAARNSTHDVLVTELHDALRLEDIPELSVDRLSDIELEWFVEIFDKYGLWGKSAGLSHRLKLELLQRDCKRHMHAILLRVFEAPQILSRLELLFQTLNSRRDYYDVVIAVLILTVLHRSFSVDALMDLTDSKVISDARFRRNEVVVQLLDLDGGEIAVRSAVAAQYILRRITSTDTVVDVLARLARRADRASAAAPYYRDVLKELMRFRNVQLLLGEQSGPAALRLYEAMKNIPGCQRQPLFWLQYAIAALFSHDLTRAEKYFQTSYAYAKERTERTGFEYDTFQIDNHYSLYLLQSVIETHDGENAMRAFRRARKIIHEQIHAQRRHHPYRVALTYGEFFDEFADSLTAADRTEIANAAKYVLGRINTLPPEHRNQRYVRQCHDAMEYVIEREAERRGAAPSSTTP